jgi:Suppressor of fused protein (SUFU).
MDKNKILANELLKAVAGNPAVTRYWDESEKKHIDIFCSDNRPFLGINTIATIGLSDYNVGLSSGNKKLRVEIIGACNNDQTEFPNILSTAAFEIIDKAKCNYGDIIPRIIELYYPSANMKHVCLMAPFLWEGLVSLELPDEKVAWLLMVPISDNEMKYALKNGINELESLFERASINIFDLNRISAI